MSQATLDQIQALANQLSPLEQARLAIYLNAQIARALATVPSASEQANRPPMTPEKARAAWAQLRESMRDLPTPRLTLAEQLERDRADRERALIGE